MSIEVKFIPKAEETYNSVVTQLNERWGAEFVNKFEDKVSKSINAMLHKNCSMFYKVYETSINIVLFWDDRQEPLFTL